MTPSDRTLVSIAPEPLGPRVRAWAREAGLELRVLAPGEPIRELPLAVWSQGQAHLVEAAHAAQQAGAPTNTPDAVELALDPRRRAEALTAGGIAVADADARGACYEFDAYYRNDGTFVPCGLTLVSGAGDSEGWMPSHLEAERERELRRLVQRASCALGLCFGPIGAQLLVEPDGIKVVELLPCFRGRPQSVHVTRLVHGRSPVQAWFASLVEAGGPFDTLPEAGSESVAWRVIPLPPGGLAALRARLPRTPRLTLDVDAEAGCATLAARGWSLAEARHLLAAALRRLDRSTAERVVA